MNKRFGDHVSVSLVIFTLGVIAIIAAIYIYSKKDDSAYQQTLSVVESLKADFKKLEQLVASNIATVGTGNVRIQELERKFETVSIVCQGNAKLIDGLESYCAKLKDSQIEMQDKLSQKRPVIKMQGPMQVEIVDKKGKGVKALIKEAK